MKLRGGFELVAARFFVSFWRMCLFCAGGGILVRLTWIVVAVAIAVLGKILSRSRVRLDTRRFISTMPLFVALYSGGGHRVADVRRLGVPKGREPLSLEEMWDVAKVESYAPGDEVIFLR